MFLFLYILLDSVMDTLVLYGRLGVSLFAEIAGLN